MWLWLTIALQAAPMGVEGTTFGLPNSLRPLTLTASSRCHSAGSDDEEVIVCGRRRDRYRLPLPAERAASPGPARGEPQTGMAALTPFGRCGIFAGERRCNRREAAEYGYGNGRDPVTLLTRLARKAVDPDAR